MFDIDPLRLSPSLKRFTVLLLCSGLVVACQSGEAPSESSEETQATAPAEPSGPTLDDALQAFRQQDLPGTTDILQQITAREPENVLAWNYLGTALKLQKRYDEAGDAMRKVLEVEPDNQGARYGLATILAVDEKPDEAFEILNQLKTSGSWDYSQITIDPELASLQSDPRFEAFLMKPEDFAQPFVEETRILHEWKGEAANDEFGWVARNIGDVDGDGHDDVVSTAPSKNLDGPNAGRIYVYSGKSGQELWRFSGQPGGRLGVSANTAGDVNADGQLDVVASAPNGGKVLVFSGSDGAVLLELAASEEGERFGSGVFGVGDLNGDGHGDVLVGAPQNKAKGAAAGRAAVYSGKSGEILHEWFGEPGERFGSMVAGGAHAEGSSFLVIGAPDAGANQGGRVYVYKGLGDQPAFTIEPDEGSSEVGRMFLSVVGDVDADGTPDIYASDWAHNAKGAQTGRIFVHSGADGSNLLTLTGEAAGDGFGIGPADAGDVNGDGHADLIIGAWQQGSGAPSGGKVYLHSGKDGSLLHAWTGRVMGEAFGFDATGMGDLDGDGKVDVLLTSAWSAINGAKSGRVYVLAGS